MRLRYATLAIAALTGLGVAGCGDDSGDKETAAPPVASPSASAAPAGDGTPGGPSAAAGSPADAGTSPTEGTSTVKPPKRGGGAAQAPVGKPAQSPDVLTAAGLGPYAIGVAQSELRSAGLVGKVTTADACATAAGLGDYHAPALAFAGGKLQRLTVTSAATATATGAKVGTSYPDLKRLYPGGTRLDDGAGAGAWFTVDGGNALLFRIKDDKVASIDAGPGRAVQFFYTDRLGC